MKELIANLLKLQTLEFSDVADAVTNDQIAKLRAKIPTPILGHYDRLGDRGKKGVAAIRNNVCTGCHMHVPFAVTLTLINGNDIRICDSCGRYLYLDEPAATSEVARRRKTAAAADKKRTKLQTF
jgi:predicted  nucleic acid-binding Zn-ribbon protein